MEFTRDRTNWIECGSFDTSENLYDHACLENNAASKTPGRHDEPTDSSSPLVVSQVAAMKPTGTQNASDQTCIACVEDGSVPVWDDAAEKIKCEPYEDAKKIKAGSARFEKTVEHFCDSTGPDGRNGVTLARLANHDASTVNGCKTSEVGSTCACSAGIKQAGVKSRTAATDGLSEQSPYGWWSRGNTAPPTTNRTARSTMWRCVGAVANAQVFHGDPVGNVNRPRNPVEGRL